MSLLTFPALNGLAFPVRRTVQWVTTKQESLSGKKARFPQYTYPTYAYEMSFNFLRTAAAFQEWQTLQAFIDQVQGAGQLWQYPDPDDGSVTNQAFGTGDGVTTQFQLIRSFGPNPYTFNEPVFLLNGTPVISVAGTPTLLFTLSPYAVVTFNSAPANGAALTWTGSYFWPCRFDDDDTPFEKFYSGFFRLKPLKFSTEKLP